MSPRNSSPRSRNAVCNGEPARWYFDFISPFAYLYLPALTELQPRLQITCVPVLFAGLLKHWGQLGPAEIPGKRLQIFRQCTWIAEQRGISFRMPPRHPFNPLHALRLIAALDGDLTSIKTIFDFIFAQGRDISDPHEWTQLCEMLGVADADARIEDASVKQRLRDNTNAAIAAGVYGVPTLEVRGELFWGNDNLDMLRDFLNNPALFDSESMRRFPPLPGVQRRR